MKKFALFLLLLSCSHIPWDKWSEDKPEEIELTSYQKFSKEDYNQHLQYFKTMYLTDKQREVIPLKKQTKEYLKSLVNNITQNNELFFTGQTESEFFMIRSRVPFHFSLPGRKFFFSSSLIEKYIKNETMLYCLLVYELIRSERYIYNKTVIIPTGTLSTSRILSLLRLDTSDKIEIHKWPFHILKRIGLDTDSYLSWLQIKNRNSLDFALQLGDVQTISREESLFKAFLIEEVKNISRAPVYKGSSRNFYRFLDELKG